ncbi:hypothetical protein [Hymenobacter psychrophilus]|uniref:Uncharacterized protein n=1 Tax=Hymenobacter psychrophilus TaxID=651662 RepID=A0A1H3H393_9BACT|nr:hypothetical protein [Hymenobacter psychrophilus]SDY09378.1 hypothetical protein SAMN04488069_105260 [Hymenobacter psychrophilus]
MKQGDIIFTASNVYYGWAIFDLTISQAEIKVHSHLSGDTDMWQTFGQQLQSFPQHAAARIIFESQLENYLLLEAYCYDAMGHTALRVVTDNKAEDPHRRRSEFSLPAEVASLNHLGRLLANWQVADNTVILWQAQTS